MGQFPEMFRIAKLLKSTEIYKPIVYFNLGVDRNHPNFLQCLVHGIDVLDYSAGFVKSEPKANPKKSIFHPVQQWRLKNAAQPSRFLRFKHYLKYKLPIFFNLAKRLYITLRDMEVPGYFNRIAVKLKRSRREKIFFKLLDPKLIILAEDSESYFTPQLIKMGHDHDVKSVVFPYTFANQYEFLEDAFFYDRRCNSSFFNFLVSLIFPKWTAEYKGKRLLKNSPFFIFSTELFRVSPPNPWVMSSGFSDVIAVESCFMKDYYSKAGIPEEQMLEVGFLSIDHLYQTFLNKKSVRENLAKRLDIDPEKPWIICAVPPSQWPRAGVGFRSYNHFLDEFFGFFSQFNDVEVIFKFHPRLDFFEVKKICDQYHIKSAEEDTVELIGMGDAYIASVSSTIRWALALGLPIINYDIYDYNYGDFDSAQNYDLVVTMDQFKDAFRKVHKQLVDSKKQASYSFQKDFAILDGKAHQRILDLFQKLTKSSETTQ